MQDHKPEIDRLNKTGNALVKLCGEQDCLKVQKILDKDNKKLDHMRNSLRDRSMSIDEALQQSAEVSKFNIGKTFHLTKKFSGFRGAFNNLK